MLLLVLTRCIWLLLIRHVAMSFSGKYPSCLDTTLSPDAWWQYQWCSGRHVRQLHYDWDLNLIESNNLIGNFIREESTVYHEVYRRAIADCELEDGQLLRRNAQVFVTCCPPIPDFGLNYIKSVSEDTPCHYNLHICSHVACEDAALLVQKSIMESNNNDDPNNKLEDDEEEEDDDDDDTKLLSKTSSVHSSSTSFNDFVLDQFNPVLVRSLPSDVDVLANLERVKAMFYHAYDSYVGLALPEAELRPLSCDGGQFELIKIPLITLIDTLDTLVIMGNHTEFRRAVSIITDYYESFDIDVNVSVFETNIRVLGGLLSAHLMAIDESLGIYGNTFDYDNELLLLSIDLGERLLPAFKTATGIPYGTVNLRYGVPEAETEISSTAGAGSLFVEFETLSILSGDPRFGDAASIAVQALYSRRSFLGLLGKHIHVTTGQWFESSSGIGSNADSFYEYLVKGYLLFRRSSWFKMFADTYVAVKKHVQVGDWFTEVDMFNGKTRRNRVENLQAFWPGIEASLGLCERSARLLNAFYAAWQDIGLLPEEFDQAVWLQGDTPVNESWYPLRPELIESTYYQYRATGDRSWLVAGSLFLDSIEKNTRTSCGYASISNIGSMEMSDNMPSYFLSETCKYLFLLFDENNFVHDRAYLFSTEAHPFDPLQLIDRPTDEQYLMHNKNNNTDVITTNSNALNPNGSPTPNKVSKRPKSGITLFHPDLSLKCPKTVWWDAPKHSYDAQFIRTHPDASGEASADSWLTNQRISIQSINAAEITRLMEWSKSTSTPFVRRESVVRPSHSNKKRADSCYDEDGPVLLKPATHPGNARGKSDSTPIPPEAPQKLEVDAGPLGMFEVTIFSDGFLVFSKASGETIEITNVGDSIAFVRELRNDSSRTVIGDQTTGKTISCSVSVENSHGAMLLVGPDHRLSCSISTFGSALFPSASIVADLRIPSDTTQAMLCKPLRGSKYVHNNLNLHAKHQRSAKISTSGQPEPDGSIDAAPKKVPWWWQLSSMLSLAGVGSKSSVQQGVDDTQQQSIDIQGAIVLVQRGGCMFEDKAGFAQQSGAVAMIVENTEDVLFVMSGKKQAAQTMRSGATAGSGNSGAEVPGQEFNAGAGTTVTIPAIMLTKSDTQLLREAIARDPEGAKVRIDLAAIPNMVDTEYMGNYDFPKLRLGPNIVHVIGSGSWGVVLTSQNGKEWQLFIMDRNDILSTSVVTPWIASTPGKQPITTTVAGTINSLEVYRNILSRKCPSYVSVDRKDGVIIEKT